MELRTMRQQLPDTTEANVAHLLRRAAWGGTPEEINSAAGQSLPAIVDSLFDVRRAPAAGSPNRRQRGDTVFSEVEFELWWWHLVATSPAPAIERLMWFWHGHFATSMNKVDSAELMHRQFVTLRRLGQGRMDDLLMAMTLDPAMNLWLDLHLSVVGTPNENYARELMELFSMGVDNGYTQTDVVEAARALTGYGLRYADPGDYLVDTKLSPEFHDHGIKTVLGRTGPLSAGDVVGAIVETPQCSEFIAGRLWLRYAGNEPDPSVIADIAAEIGTTGTIGAALRRMFTHPAFYSDEAKQGLVMQPVEAMARVARNFGLPISDVDLSSIYATDDGDVPGEVYEMNDLTWRTEQLGQQVGRPPNVAGWPHNEPWLDTNRSAARVEVGRDLGWTIFSDEDVNRTPAVEQLLTLSSPRQFAEGVLRQFGLVEWSDATLDAVTTAGNRDGDIAHDFAFAAAFVSPEVTLS